MNIKELQNILVCKEFNPYINISNQDKVLLHLIEEVGELVKVHQSWNNGKIEDIASYRKQLSEEIADVLILLSFYASSVDMDLEHSLLEKLRENINRRKFKPSNKIIKELWGNNKCK